MASINTRSKPQLPPQGGTAPQAFEPSNTLRTHEGAPAARITPELELRRSVCSCLLWEDTFYESGQEIAARIASLASVVPPKVLSDLAIDARSHFHLRHVPLLLCGVLARTGSGSSIVSETIAKTIQRPDELSEFLAVYAKLNGVLPSAVKKKLSAQVKKGLAAAFSKFDQYQLAKYFSQSGEKGAEIRGRDVLFLSHARPRDEQQKELFRRIATKESVQQGGADTWETALSSGADKKETFERQLRDKKLGYLALLRNLRNMTNAGVDIGLIREAILERRGARRVLPFRYVAAARACPQLEPAIDQALSEAVAELPLLPGKTVVLVDVSGSMRDKLSGKSDLTRMDAAATLASIIHGDLRVFTFSAGIVEVAPRRGMAGVQVIVNSQPHSGTYLGQAIVALNGQAPMVAGEAWRRRSSGLITPGPFYTQVTPRRFPAVEMDRLIVITDEQSHDQIPVPNASRAYLINVASNQNGIGYGDRWTHIDGFSEQVLRFIHEFEAL